MEIGMVSCLKGELHKRTSINPLGSFRSPRLRVQRSSVCSAGAAIAACAVWTRNPRPRKRSCSLHTVPQATSSPERSAPPPCRPSPTTWRPQSSISPGWTSRCAQGFSTPQRRIESINAVLQTLRNNSLRSTFFFQARIKHNMFNTYYVLTRALIIF